MLLSGEASRSWIGEPFPESCFQLLAFKLLPHFSAWQWALQEEASRIWQSTLPLPKTRAFLVWGRRRQGATAPTPSQDRGDPCFMKAESLPYSSILPGSWSSHFCCKRKSRNTFCSYQGNGVSPGRKQMSVPSSCLLEVVSVAVDVSCMPPWLGPPLQHC